MFTIRVNLISLLKDSDVQESLLLLFTTLIFLNLPGDSTL